MSDLLDVLQEKAGCPYLSDLRTVKFRLKALEEALSLLPESFPLRQWQEAARYLLDQEETLSSVEEVRNRLRESYSRR